MRLTCVHLRISLFIPNYTLPKSVDRKFSWVAKNTTEQALEADSADFRATWVPDRVVPRLRFRASRLLDAGTYTVGLTSSKVLELPAGGLHADDARITLASDARARQAPVAVEVVALPRAPHVPRAQVLFLQNRVRIARGGPQRRMVSWQPDGAMCAALVRLPIRCEFAAEAALGGYRKKQHEPGSTSILLPPCRSLWPPRVL